MRRDFIGDKVRDATYLTAAALLLGIAAPWRLAAQHAMADAPPTAAAGRDTTPMAGMSMAVSMTGPLGLPMSRDGSGTSWLPDAAPMHANHFTAGSWELMLHYLAFGYYDRQGGADPAKRGDDQIGSVNWVMLMASHGLAGGRLQLRGMFSAEPWTVGRRGYPLLLQSGESYHGQPLHDRQHPHDLFMELAANYERAIAPNLGIQLYVAPVGEPASGPPAFPHRPSAGNDPMAPLSHHWQDATHISFGVISAGIFTRMWKLEGSVFNGREPDEDRTDIDFRRLDSYAGRITVNPAAAWSLSGSYAYLASPEVLFPGVSQHRLTASVLNDRGIGTRGRWSSALIWGANKESGDAGLSNSALLESNADLDTRNSVFGRIEYVQKSARDLAVTDTFVPDRIFDIGSVSAGYVRELTELAGGSVGIGVQLSLDLVPGSLEPVYGTRSPSGVSVFFRLRPREMRIGLQ